MTVANTNSAIYSTLVDSTQRPECLYEEEGEREIELREYYQGHGQTMAPKAKDVV